MNQNECNNNYSIILPETVDPQVQEWFEFMNANGNLATELIKLVNDHINNCNQMQDACITTSDQLIEAPLSQDYGLSQDDLFDSLYNYQASSNAIFFEEKKPKKKMLSV